MFKTLFYSISVCQREKNSHDIENINKANVCSLRRTQSFSTRRDEDERSDLLASFERHHSKIIPRAKLTGKNKSNK